ncbi:1,2-dihydroxy-3-keto-5-methylthiopentene dioxygenase [Streptomyces luteolus]|uniref:Acireductone dioxygenase n=1 Tax=Streptomyces luteolus TaxID=3043615 RepID=A0ABT6STP2_9ACTN|nr:cupin domain-containing protein [Streptomyces sp. B-S-A12]MDI3418017.1 cupin domain-containing protein [Streptomyces sp. B-S-A12]
MTHLSVMPDDEPERVLLHTGAAERIREELGAIGVRFEQWQATRPLPNAADSDTVLGAYRPDVDRICEEGGYRLVDVARLRPDPEDPQWPEKARAARTKFLDEHFHTEDEVRFFVDGSGCFYLHLNQRVYAMVCTAGDLISVPANTVHWFDMGSTPDFTAIRFFQEEDGWVGNFLPTSIAHRFPTLDDLNSAFEALT